MELNKNLWTEADRVPFLSYLKTFEQPSKVDWGRRILNTNLPLLAMTTKSLDDMVKSIFKGNYLSFLELEVYDYYESIAIAGKLICKITDFNVMRTYLDRYSLVMENWAHCDLLSFDITPNSQHRFIELSQTYATSTRPFIRRLSLMILFQMVKNPPVLPVIYKALLNLKDETEYYVIMMAGWLLSECIILYKADTLAFISKENMNPKVVNKGIQKCRESRRLTLEEKDALSIYKRQKSHER